MRCAALLLLISALACIAPGQVAPDSAAPAAVSPWTHSLVGLATLTQVSFKDWAQGGDNTLALALTLDGKSKRTGEVLDWANSYKFAFGQARLGSQPLRKTDDKIELESILTYKLGVFVNPYAAATLKTQFVQGYKYDNLGGKVDTVSGFFDPAYLTQSAGVGYQPVPEVKIRLGAALREVFTSKFNIYSDDPATPLEVEKTKVDGGIESVTDVQTTVMENVLLTSKLELFASFRDFEKVVVRSDNTLAAKINTYLTVNLNVQFIHEPSVSVRTQVKQTLALGLSYTFL